MGGKGWRNSEEDRCYSGNKREEMRRREAGEKTDVDDGENDSRMEKGQNHADNSRASLKMTFITRGRFV